MQAKQFLFKAISSSAASVVLLACGASAHAQAFTETFGNDATRVSNAYVPSSNFGFAASGGISDGNYTVMRPQNVAASTGSPWWIDLPTDHSGDATGALMVLNAGPALNEFYVRNFNTQPGHSYRISAWRYVVNGDGGAGSTNPIYWSLQVRDPSTNEPKVKSADLPSTQTQAWFESVYEFRVPVDCAAPGTAVPARLALTNRSPVGGGNDFYIDDISVTDITPNDELDPYCPLPMADVSITKSNAASSAKPGDTVTYTLVASNAGPDAAANTTVADTLPAALTGAAWTCTGTAGGICGAASGTGNISDTVTLPAGASVTYTLTASVSATATGALVNTATIALPAGMSDPTPGNNSATATVTLPVPAATAVPTLGAWALGLLVGLLGVMGFRRRQGMN